MVSGHRGWRTRLPGAQGTCEACGREKEYWVGRHRLCRIPSTRPGSLRFIPWWMFLCRIVTEMRAVLYEDHSGKHKEDGL